MTTVTDSAPIRIIAWGNRGRRDDGAALVLAERLEVHFAGRDDVVVQQYHQLGPELVDDLADCRQAIFIDASSRHDAGGVCIEPLVPMSTSAGLDTHHCPPDALLALAASLGLPVPEAFLVDIRGHEWAFGDDLSEATARLVDEAERAILRFIGPAVVTTDSPST